MTTPDSVAINTPGAPAGGHDSGPVDPGKQLLRVLMVEDSDDDAELLRRELTSGGFAPSVVRVCSDPDLRAALRSGPYDIVISDWSMPSFSGLHGFRIVREHDPDIPYIIVSGTIDEEVAVDALRAGVHDFMAKHRLARLLPAIHRELREARMRKERRQAAAEAEAVRQQLMVADRMASVGMLAAGVAHEINNPLAAAIANLDLAIELSRKGPPVDPADQQAFDEMLADSMHALDRVRQIVSDLKIFSRHKETSSRATDVHQVLESTLRMASNGVRHSARLIKEFKPVPRVLGSDSRLGQVFLNLVMNAVQAMPEGNADKNRLRIATRTDGPGWVVVEVEDTGSGIEAELLPQLFTPFFTTKSEGVGTGLGLAICRRIVTEMGGEIEVESEVGKGTTFRVRLPAATRVSEAPPPDPRVTRVSPTRRGRVLVIDDEPMIGTVVSRTLGGEHDVVAEQHAAEALARLVRGEHFDVIFCDVMMPQMTGEEFHSALLASAPAHAEKLIFLTGGAFTTTTREFLQRIPNLYLEKPFNPAEIRTLVNQRVR